MVRLVGREVGYDMEDERWKMVTGWSWLGSPSPLGSTLILFDDDNRGQGLSSTANLDSSALTACPHRSSFLHTILQFVPGCLMIAS